MPFAPASTKVWPRRGGPCWRAPRSSGSIATSSASAAPGIALVYIKGSFELIRERLLQRTGHFMKDSMLASQFAALEEPTEAIVVDAAGSLDETFERSWLPFRVILRRLA